MPVQNIVGRYIVCTNRRHRCSPRLVKLLIAKAALIGTFEESQTSDLIASLAHDHLTSMRGKHNIQSNEIISIYLRVHHFNTYIDSMGLYPLEVRLPTLWKTNLPKDYTGIKNMI